MAYPEVMQLREYVAKEGETNQVAENVARGVVGASVQVEEQGASIPAFELLKEQRYADLIDYMLPGVSSEFGVKCANTIKQFLIDVQINGIDSIKPEAPDDDDDNE